MKLPQQFPKMWAANIALIRTNIRRVLKINEHYMNVRHAYMRQARLLKATGNKFNARRAESLEAKAQEIFEQGESSRELLRNLGQSVMQTAKAINEHVPQSLLMDLLAINVTDRSRVEPSDGIIELTFIKGMEDSAYYRKCDWKCGPIAEAIQAFMNYEMLHNEELKNSMHNYMFGKGGMFEFLPTYTRTQEGEFIKKRPKLRLADPEVDKAKAA